MFPVSDFNFVVAGIATFAATVGYACSRRLNASSSFNTPSEEVPQHSFAGDRRVEEKESTIPSPHRSLDEPQMEVELKQNSDLSEMEEVILGYPHNLANIYPNKRCRTPSSDSGELSAPDVAPPVAADSIAPLESTPEAERIPEMPATLQDSVSIPTPATEPPQSPSPAPEQPEQPTRRPSPTPISAFPLSMSVPTPQPIFALEITPRPATPKAFSNTSGGFAAFAGSSSPFAAVNKPKTSAFKPAKSIWNTSDLTPRQNGEETVKIPSAFTPETEDHAIAEAKASPLHPTEKYTPMTGEEDEDVELEQKGVKLYTKRGDKPFSEGVLGHVKLLSNRLTLEERILFRRDPLWKVSMNIRVRPSVRCTYVPEENVLRLILKETVEKTDPKGEEKQEVVIYAIKPGRTCSKQDFKDFAQALMKSSHFKEISS
ncbi:hypothetical protein JR316_0007875 [Psilocybe cubensis]|uniref:RanBD1 domain-containing protein n=2 Tax=Psilocybe cubensis TaxID=181762 RepID=A0A8H7XT05_PSICU|nr:hypothetical protein JR316_0007875 [Psilocybe cubensis]KAH9479287.1 hypothetical protein JR316_0007875 [Psilocybe cubensis]